MSGVYVTGDNMKEGKQHVKGKELSGQIRDPGDQQGYVTLLTRN